MKEKTVDRIDTNVFSDYETTRFFVVSDGEEMKRLQGIRFEAPAPLSNGERFKA